MLVHGKISTYTQHGCRCDECRKAHTMWKKLYDCGLIQKRERKHGTISKYNAGCRCQICKTACRDYTRARRRKFKELKQVA